MTATSRPGVVGRVRLGRRVAAAEVRPRRGRRPAGWTRAPAGRARRARGAAPPATVVGAGRSGASSAHRGPTSGRGDVGCRARRRPLGVAGGAQGARPGPRPRPRRRARARTAAGRRCGTRRAGPRGRRARRRRCCAGAQRGAVDEQRLGVGLLQVDHAEHHRLDLRLDVVRLVDRQARQRPSPRQLAEDQEQLERVDRADDQVVVGVLAVVEVEAAEPALVGSSATICSTLVPCAWWPRSTSTCARSPSRWQTSSAEPQSARSVA